MGHSECVQDKQGSPTALDSIFSFHHVSPRKRTPAVRLGGKYSYPMSHLACLNPILMSTVQITILMVNRTSWLRESRTDHTQPINRGHVWPPVWPGLFSSVDVWITKYTPFLKHVTGKPSLLLSDRLYSLSTLPFWEPYSLRGSYPRGNGRGSL